MSIRFGWDCEGPTPEPSWIEELGRLAPRTEYGHDWLMLRWEPGDPWDPVERWMVWQMTPAPRVSKPMLDWLHGPNPRDFGYYDSVKRRFISRYEGMISYQQWDVFRQHKALGRPLWVVQGRGGGHKRRFSDLEGALLEARGKPGDAPAPGLLPYAEPDRRTWKRLHDMDLVIEYGDLLTKVSNPDIQAILDEREKTQLRKVAQELSQWLDDSMSEALDLTYSEASTLNSLADSDTPPLERDQVEPGFVDSLVEAYR